MCQKPQSCLSVLLANGSSSSGLWFWTVLPWTLTSGCIAFWAAVAGHMLQLGPCQRWRKKDFHHVSQGQNPAHISHGNRYFSGNSVMLLTLVHLVIYSVPLPPPGQIFSCRCLPRFGCCRFEEMIITTYVSIPLSWSAWIASSFCVLVIYSICQKYSKF